MSSTRIRYVKFADQELRSVKKFTSSSTNAQYEVRLLLDTMEFIVYNTNSARVVYREGGPKNMECLKNKAKRYLKKLGVQFEREVRMVSDNGDPTRKI